MLLKVRCSGAAGGVDIDAGHAGRYTSTAAVVQQHRCKSIAAAAAATAGYACWLAGEGIGAVQHEQCCHTAGSAPCVGCPASMTVVAVRVYHTLLSEQSTCMFNSWSVHLKSYRLCAPVRPHYMRCLNPDNSVLCAGDSCQPCGGPGLGGSTAGSQCGSGCSWCHTR